MGLSPKRGRQEARARVAPPRTKSGPDAAGREASALTSTIVHDAAALVAAERNDRRMWPEHRVRFGEAEADAAVVELAVRRRADIVTGDRRDLSKLTAAAGARPRPRILEI